MENEMKFKLTANQKQKMRDLFAMVAAKKEEARTYNYMRPQAPNHLKHFKRAQQRAQQRLEGVILGLMDRYALEQGVSFQEIQIKVTEDPTRLESLYEEAISLIPKHYLPIRLSNDREKFTYNPFQQGQTKGIPYVRPVLASPTQEYAHDE